MCYIYDTDRERFKFSLSNNEIYLNGFKHGITSDLYVCKDSNAEFKYDYYELGNNIDVKGEKTELCCYVTTPENNVSYVIYSINGNYHDVAYGAPYKVDVDFSGFKGQKVDVTVSAFDEKQMLISTYSVKINVI